MSSLARLSSEELCFLKGMRILVNASAIELRRIFKDVWDRQNPQHPWRDDAQSGLLFFNNHKPKNVNTMYDDKIKTGRRADWDMTVLCRVFIQRDFCADTKYRANVDKLRKLRNIYSHVKSMSRSQAEFDDDLETVKSVFQELGLNEDVLNDALHVEDSDDQQLREEMQQLQLKLHEEVRAEIQLLKDEMHDRFDRLDARLDGGATSGDGQTGEIENPQSTQLPDWFVRLPAPCRNQRITEQDLVKIVKHIGGNWELVAVELDIKKTEREKAIATIRTPDMQMMSVFMKWVQKESKRATREAFIEALYACNDTCTIDWDGIEEAFKKMLP